MAKPAPSPALSSRASMAALLSRLTVVSLALSVPLPGRPPVVPPISPNATPLTRMSSMSLSYTVSSRESVLHGSSSLLRAYTVTVYAVLRPSKLTSGIVIVPPEAEPAPWVIVLLPACWMVYFTSAFSVACSRE